MIKVRFYKNPLEKDGFEETQIKGTRILVSDLRVKLNKKFNAENLVIIRKKKILKETSIVNDKDELIVFHYVEDPGFWAAVWTVLVVSYWVAVAASVIYAIYLACQGQSKPSYGTDGDGIDDGSPTYSWNGIQTTADVGIPIPVVYGEHKVGGNIINAFINSDGDKNYLNILLALCEGEIESISGITINDQPVDNFDGITVFSDRLGTNNDTVIPNFNDLYDNYTVGQAINTKDSNYVYTTQGSAVEGFEVQLSFPNGIFQQNNSNGQIESWSVGIKVEYKLHDAEEYQLLVNTTISATQRTDLKRYFRKDGLTPGQYDIRVTRTTDGGGFYTYGDCSFSYLVEIRTDDLAYPNVAKLGIKALATNQISGSTPNIGCVVKGKKIEIPQIMCSGEEVGYADIYWDPVAEEYKRFSDDASCTWDGETWVVRWSANPVWCLRDLLISTRYGLGSHIDTALINKDEWHELAKYCDERVTDGLGGYEKRFRLDIVLDSQNRAIDTLMEIVQSFRGMLFYAGATFSLAIEKPASPVQLFGDGNIIDGTLTQSFRPIKECNNVIEAQYLDKDQDYKQQIVSVIDEAAIDAGDPIRKQSVRIYTTRLTQALREARFQMLQQKYLTRSISFKAGIDAIACQPGDVIAVSNDFTGWGFHGRVQSGSTDTSVKLDRTVTIESGKTYSIFVRFANDTIEERTITTVPGSVNEVQVSAAFSAAPAAYDVFTMGELNKAKKNFRVIGMRRTNDLECEIQAIEYNEAIYDTDSIVIPTQSVSALSLEVPAVESLKLTERLVRLSDGTIESCIDVWWRKPDPNSIYVLYKKAKVWISDNAGLSWMALGETDSDHFQIIGDIIDGTQYKVAVTTVATDGRETSISGCPAATITLVGKTAAPANVSGFIVNQYRDRVVMSWPANTDVDLFGYEIRKGESWVSGELVVEQLQNTRYVDYNVKIGTEQKYFIKAIDTSGNYSQEATEAIITIANVPFTNVVKTTQEHADWTGTKTGTQKVGDNLEVSDGEVEGTYVTDVIDLGFLATFKIGIVATVIDASVTQKWSDLAGLKWSDLPRFKRWSGYDAVGAVAYRIKISEDNITWSDWVDWQTGDYYARYYQIEMTLMRADITKVVRCTALTHIADLPDVDENIDGTIATAEDGVDITFTKTFHEDPAVNVTILSGDGVYHKISSLDTTGCNIKLYDASGTLQTGTIRAHIHGL